MAACGNLVWDKPDVPAFCFRRTHIPVRYVSCADVCTAKAASFGLPEHLKL